MQSTKTIDLRFVKGASDPYQETDMILDVNMDTFVILIDRQAYNFKFIEEDDGDSEVSFSPSYRLIERIANVDFLCTRGVSTCFAIYAKCFDEKDIYALAHISVLVHPNVALTVIKEAVADVLKKSLNEINIDFFLFGSTPEVLADTIEDAPIQAPENCYVDSSSRILNADLSLDAKEDEGYAEDINVFVCKETIVIHQAKAYSDIFIAYQQSLDKNSQLRQIPPSMKRNSATSVEGEILNKKGKIYSSIFTVNSKPANSNHSSEPAGSHTKQSIS